jgi:hypothetical protein
MITNTERAGCAAAACKAYECEKGSYGDDEIRNVIVDLMADLLHLAKQNDIDAARCLWLAEDHYLCELMDEGVSDG